VSGVHSRNDFGGIGFGNLGVCAVTRFMFMVVRTLHGKCIEEFTVVGLQTPRLFDGHVSLSGFSGSKAIAAPMKVSGLKLNSSFQFEDSFVFPIGAPSWPLDCCESSY
jgi:hypothetical protein